MDVDAYAKAHRPSWQRLTALLRRRRRLSGAEADELVRLYQRAATHLSVVRSAAPHSPLAIELTSLVARARAAVAGTSDPAWRDLARFLTVTFPAALYAARRWWLTTGAAWIAVSAVVATWVATNPSVQASLGTPEDLRQLVDEDFAAYYSENPAGSFAAQVWTNNAFIAAASLITGIGLGLPVVWVLWQNAVNVAASAGVMAAFGRLDVFFGLITPHGLLELTAVFVAAGAGLRLGWTLVDPGPLPRGAALAAEGRRVTGIALGLVLVLLLSGLIEAFVTPSPLPTWARIGIGVAAEIGFLAYVWVLGRRAAAAGETGDVRLGEREDLAPVAA